MFDKGRKKGTVRFAIDPGPNVAKVALAGDFSEWEPVTMRRQKNGQFVALLSLAPGAHEYKFLLDGNWMTDPDNGTWALNAFGSVNSIAQIE